MTNVNPVVLNKFFERLPQGFRARIEEWNLTPEKVYESCRLDRTPAMSDTEFNFHKSFALKYFSRGGNFGDYPECLYYLIEVKCSR